MQADRDPSEDRYLVRFPGLLQGVKCYTDASTSPDLPSLTPRNAGIGLFIINTQIHPAKTIYIKAIMTATTSVLMAEAAAMALGHLSLILLVCSRSPFSLTTSVWCTS